MRVLAVSSYGVLGGAELAMSAFLAACPRGVEARAVVLNGGALVERLVAQGVAATTVPGMAGRPTAASALRFGHALRRDLHEWRPDVVWACGPKGALLSWAPCRSCRVPLVWHKVDFSWDGSLARPLAWAVDGVVSVSDAVVEALGPRLRARRHLGAVGVPVALDPTLRAAPDQGRPVLATLARLVPYKGIDRMIRATALLRDEFPTVRLVVAGAPVAEYADHPGELAALISSLDLKDAVELRGFVSDVAPILRDTTVFINATYRDPDGFGLEGMPGSILEASWMGIPVVAPGDGGNVEAVRDGETGTLVAAPEPALLANAVAPYLRDRALWERTGQAGRVWTHGTFSPRATAQRLFAALGQVAEAPTQRAPSGQLAA